MSAPWFKFHADFFRHPKTAQLKDAEVIALQKLWCWAAESESVAGIDGHVPEAMLRPLGVRPQQMRRLEDVGFVHRNGTGWYLHAWKERQGALLERRAKDRGRKREERSA